MHNILFIKKLLLVGLFFFLSVILISGCKNQSDGQEKPNFLFFIYDDASWEHFGCYGDKAIKTPGTDKLAQEGILFTNAYCAAPSCSPSRAAILTGQDIYRLEEGAVLWGSLEKKFKVLPDLLEDAGYSCGYIGKPYWPAYYEADSVHSMPTGPCFNILRDRNVREGLTLWSDYTPNFKIFLNQLEEGQPFFFWVGIQEPHVPWPEGFGIEMGIDTSKIRIPEFLPDIHETRMDISDYMGEIMWAEKYIKEMVQILEDKGLKNNTLIVTTSDNGIPIPRSKATLYDYGVRIPLVMSWADKIHSGRIVDNPVSLIDMAPTFLDLARIEIPEEMTGRSLKNIILSEQSGTVKNERDFVVSAIERHVFCRAQRQGYPRRAIHTEDYTYIINFESSWWPCGDPDILDKNGNPRFGDCDPGRAKSFLIQNQENAEFKAFYELCFGKIEGEQLFSKKDDPDMIKNLAYDHEFSDIKEELKAKLENYLKNTSDPRIIK